MKLLEDLLKIFFPYENIQSIVIESNREASFTIVPRGKTWGRRLFLRWDEKLNFTLFEVQKDHERQVHPLSTIWRRVYKLINDRHLDAENLKS